MYAEICAAASTVPLVSEVEPVDDGKRTDRSLVATGGFLNRRHKCLGSLYSSLSCAFLQLCEDT